MTKISIAFFAAMSFAGSGCHKNKGDADKASAIAKLTELKNKMCACKDKTCSDQVSAELAAWGREQEKSGGDQPASPDEDSEKLESLKEETASCLLKIEVPSGAGAPGAAAAGAASADGSADPAAGSAAAGSAAAGSAAAGSAAAGSAAAGSAAAGSAH